MISINEITKSIVIAFRGTLSINDTITDLICDIIDYKFMNINGKSHKGFIQTINKI